MTAALTPPKTTASADGLASKFEPEIVRVVPTPPKDGDKYAMAGEVEKIKPGKVAVPVGVTTWIVPLSPVPTTASMVDESITVKDAAAVPPKLTKVAPVKFSPLRTTGVPDPP